MTTETKLLWALNGYLFGALVAVGHRLSWSFWIVWGVITALFVVVAWRLSRQRLSIYPPCTDEIRRKAERRRDR